MSTFAVAAFYDEEPALGAGRLDAVLWVRAAGLEAGADVCLHVWTPAGVEVVALRAIEPAEDLLPRAVDVDDHTATFDAGRWTDGVHEFDLAVALPARAAGERMLVARVSFVAGEEVAGSAVIAVTWASASADPTPAASAPTDVPSSDPAAGSSRTGAAAADLPTGASPGPGDPSFVEAGAGEQCADCGVQPEPGDRFCEACGRQLR